MPNEPEKLWDYDAVAIGQTGTETTVTLTTGHAARVRPGHPACPWVGTGSGRTIRRPRPQSWPCPAWCWPTRRCCATTWRRHNGFVALEDSKTARRQTPFAKCDIRWHAPVVVGDCITATRRVLDKYERRGSKFVTFRVEALNQRGVRVADYDYTCIFAYAQGQKSVPASGGSREPGKRRSSPGSLWPKGASGADGRAGYAVGTTAAGASGHGEPGHDSGL